MPATYTPDNYFFETFENDLVARGWTYRSVGPSAGFPAFRTGNGFAMTGNPNFLSRNLVVSSRYIWGYLHKIDTLTTGDILAKFTSGGSTQIVIDCVNTGAIRYYVGATLVYTSSAGLIAGSSSTIYVEVDTLIDASAGYIEVRLDEVVVHRYTGNTAGAGNNNIDAFTLANNNISSTRVLDDGYFAWGSSVSYLGDISVSQYLPTSDGFYTQFTPNSGTSHYTRVDEASPNNGDTDYNRGPALSSYKDTYKFPTPTLLPILAIQLVPIARKDDIGSLNLRNLFRTASAGNDYQGNSQALTQVYTAYPEALLLNPDTGVAWIGTDITNGEFGPSTTP